jgi:hypothetical protein
MITSHFLVVLRCSDCPATLAAEAPPPAPCGPLRPRHRRVARTTLCHDAPSQVCDRKTIERHLLSDETDPFNRIRLTACPASPRPSASFPSARPTERGPEGTVLGAISRCADANAPRPWPHAMRGSMVCSRTRPPERAGPSCDRPTCSSQTTSFVRGSRSGSCREHPADRARAGCPLCACAPAMPSRVSAQRPEVCVGGSFETVRQSDGVCEAFWRTSALRAQSLLMHERGYTSASKEDYFSTRSGRDCATVARPTSGAESGLEPDLGQENL